MRSFQSYTSSQVHKQFPPVQDDELSNGGVSGNSDEDKKGFLKKNQEKLQEVIFVLSLWKWVRIYKEEKGVEVCPGNMEDHEKRNSENRTRVHLHQQRIHTRLEGEDLGCFEKDFMASASRALASMLRKLWMN